MVLNCRILASNWCNFMVLVNILCLGLSGSLFPVSILILSKNPEKEIFGLVYFVCISRIVLYKASSGFISFSIFTVELIYPCLINNSLKFFWLIFPLIRLMMSLVSWSQRISFFHRLSLNSWQTSFFIYPILSEKVYAAHSFKTVERSHI